MITVKIDDRAHAMLKLLSKRYKKETKEKGQISLSETINRFVGEHAPDVATAANTIVETQDEFIGDNDNE